MAAKPICLTEYRKRKQGELRLKSEKEQDTPKLLDFGSMELINPFSLFPFETAEITDITEEEE